MLMFMFRLSFLILTIIYLNGMVRKKYNYQPQEENIPLLYILYEMDKPHIIFLDAWLARQDGIADTINVEKFGGISVERRLRK